MLPRRPVLCAVAAPVCFAVAIGWSPTALGQQADSQGGSTESVTTSITTLPDVDRSIHDAMQSRSFGEAVKRIEAAIGDGKLGPPDYLRYLQGIALTEDEKFDQALEAFEQLERDHPESSWISRSRFGRANVHVLRREYIRAGEIYQAEAERLLSKGRKDKLAAIYLEFADRYYEGVAADDPSREKKPDFQQAVTYYSEAAKLDTTAKLSQKIAFRIARCQQELEQYLSLIHISEPTRPPVASRMPSSA